MAVPVALQSSASAEWYTPAEYVDAARDVMGGIDLDPASCELANLTVRATRIYTRHHDGLAQPWSGRVWCNPPYGRGPGNRSNQAIWSEHLAREYDAGRVEQACLLVNAVPDRTWFRALWDRPICFVDGRIRFYRGAGDVPASSTHASVIVYYGTRVDRFAERFSLIGRVVVPRGAISEVA